MRRGVLVRRSARIGLSILAVLLLTLLGCGGGGGGADVIPVIPGGAEDPVDAELGFWIGVNGLDGDPTPPGPLPTPEQPLAELGKRLFFSKALSGDRDSACVSCHHPSLGGGDGLSLSVGVAAVDQDLLGPGREHAMVAVGYDGGPPVPRNAPTTFNVASWRRRLMLDGRIERVGGGPPGPGGPGGPGGGISTPDTPAGVADPNARPTLAATQSRFPLTDEAEMKGFAHAGKDGDAMRTYLAGRLGGYGAGGTDLVDPGYWVTKFRAVFGPGPATAVVTPDTIADALGAYVDSQNLFASPWFRYVRGDLTALSASAKRGALVFFRPIGGGGAQCSSCHAGDLFSDEDHHLLAIPQVGRGKGDGVGGFDDFGRFRVTGNFNDLYAFRTPTLLNVAVTGPFGHSGAYETLEGVVRHHSNPAAAIAAYDPSTLAQPGIQNTGSWQQRATDALAKLRSDRLAGRPVLQDSNLTDAQVTDVVAFLEALTDPCVQDPGCAGRWDLDPASDPDPNGDQVVPRFTP